MNLQENLSRFILQTVDFQRLKFCIITQVNGDQTYDVLELGSNVPVFNVKSLDKSEFLLDSPCLILNIDENTSFIIYGLNTNKAFLESEDLTLIKSGQQLSLTSDDAILLNSKNQLSLASDNNIGMLSEKTLAITSKESLFIDGKDIFITNGDKIAVDIDENRTILKNRTEIMKLQVTLTKSLEDILLLHSTILLALDAALLGGANAGQLTPLITQLTDIVARQRQQ